MTRRSIDYRSHPPVRELIARVRFAAECVSLGFDGWDEPALAGPGLYVGIVADREYGMYADSMGDTRWPVKQCASAYTEDAFVDTGGQVARECDGAAIIAVDGQIESSMVRFRNYSDKDVDPDEISYEPWMGARHMSAIETSLRPAVVATVTLSEETGRVSTFEDGTMHTATRDQIAERWRSA